MEFAKNVQIDISCTTPTAIIREKQLDNGTRTIYATFHNSETNEDVAFTGSETFEFRIERSDGVLVTSDAVYESKQIVITLTSDMLGVCGRARCDVRAKTGDNILSGGSFFIDVQPLAIGTRSDSVVIGGEFFNTKALSREQYNSLTTFSANTIYLVDDSFYDDEIVMTVYVGDKKIGSGGTNEAGEMSLYLLRDVAQHNASYARLYSSEDFGVVLAREIYAQYSPAKTETVALYEQTNEETEETEGVAKISARDRVILECQNSGESVTLEINKEGAFLNGKKLGGGSSTPQNLKNTVTTTTTVQRGS